MSQGKDGHIYKAAGIIVVDRKLLVERSRNKKFFIAPGGSIEDGETPKLALVRELQEEFNIDVKEENLEEFGFFEAAAAGQEHNTVHMHVFTIHDFEGVPHPSSEVEEIAWVNSKNEQKLPLGSIFEHEVIPILKDKDLID
jgi:8-oxo-dGTP pyrophosphatase MutT (NUDIX family)